MQAKTSKSITLAMKKIGFSIGLLILTALVLWASFGQVAIQALAAILFGWWGYLARVIPRVTVSRAGLATVTLCGVLFLLGLHGFLRWLHREMVRDERRWKMRWTLSIVSVVMLMFAAGIATVGVTHQTAWLLTSKRPLLEPHARLYHDPEFEMNLKVTALAVHNYASAYDNDLPGGRSSEGHALQSWQTLIAGFIPFNPGEIDLNSAWDAPRNAPHFRGFVSTYINPKARVLRDARGFALSHIAGNVHVFGRGRSLKLNEVGNLSQILLAGEVASGFKCWGDPTNLRDPSHPFDGSPEAFGSPTGGGATVVMMDGSVKFISDRADPKILRALSGPR